MEITLKQKKTLIKLIAKSNGKKTKAISAVQKMKPSFSFADAKTFLEKIIKRSPENSKNKQIKCNLCGITENAVELNTVKVRIGCRMCNGEMIPKETGCPLIDAANATSDS